MRKLHLIVVFAFAALPGCSKPAVEQVETQAAVPVTVEAARTERLQATISAAGVVTPAPGAELTVIAPAHARIAELPKGEGDAVRQGDVLVRFDIPSLGSDVASKRASVAQAEARLEAAKAAFARLSGLVGQGVAAPREVEDAKRDQAEAEADLAQARTGVDAAIAMSNRAVVRAPFAGVVSKRFHNEGDLVDAAAGDPILKLINPARLEVVVNVPVAQIPRVVIGRSATVATPGSDSPELAKVMTRPAQVDAASATAPVRLAFSKPTGLAAGTVVQVAIVGEERADALVIPAVGVVEDEGEIFVMVAGADNKAHKYPIALGLQTHDLVEVTTGIKAGDRVIVKGQVELPEGAAITVEK